MTNKILRYLDTRKLLVILVLLLAFFLRVYKISEFPAGLNADEAAIGYNAYSLLQTGRDEFGHSWPVNFQSFNDYKPGLYFYLVLPFVKIFGLNETAVRLPSAILGTLTVWILYLLVKKMFRFSGLALISAFLLAISPWHLHFSRGGWESNAALFFIVTGVYFFYKGLENPKSFTFCVISFALSMYTYHSARVISPLLGIGLLIFYRKEIFQRNNIKILLVSGLLLFLFLLPLAKSFLTKEGTSRFSGVGIFADQGPFWRVNELRGQHVANPFGLFPKIMHNKIFEYGVLFFDNWLRHFRGDFLFISGDEIQRNRIPEMGQMYLVEIPFLILGIYFLIKNRPEGWKFITYWLVVSPIASALTFQSPHAIRALGMVIPLAVVTGYGITSVWKWCNNKNKTIVILLYCYIVIGFTWNTVFYLHQYYVHYPKTYPAAWEDGFRQMVEYVSANKKEGEKVFITNKYDQPYIITAFYLKYPPKEFQKEAVLTPRDKFGFSTVESFGDYNFMPITEEVLKENNAMIIGTPAEVPNSATIIKRIYYKDGKTEAFRIIRN